jgi:hypothetical protein
MRSFIEDNSGGLSLIRLICGVWMLILMILWIKAAWQTTGIPDIPSGAVALTSALIASKAVQRFGEKSDNVISPDQK